MKNSPQSAGPRFSLLFTANAALKGFVIRPCAAGHPGGGSEPEVQSLLERVVPR